MLSLDSETLRIGLERACDLFRLHRLSSSEEADGLARSVFANFGLDEDSLALLVEAIVEMLPISGEPVAEGLMTSSMCAGVLVGLVLADATLPGSPEAFPDCLPQDL